MLVIDAATRRSFSAMTEENLEELLADPAVSVRPYACSVINQILNERHIREPPPPPRRKTARRLFCFE
jgi:hypothetical protein